MDDTSLSSRLTPFLSSASAPSKVQAIFPAKKLNPKIVRP